MTTLTASRPCSEDVQMAQSINPDDGRIGWVAHALCRSSDPDELFVRGAAQRKAALICRDCPVIVQCLVDALDNHIDFGIWGGMTERQRRALVKQHPEVHSWSEFFAGAAGDPPNC